MANGYTNALARVRGGPAWVRGCGRDPAPSGTVSPLGPKALARARPSFFHPRGSRTTAAVSRQHKGGCIARSHHTACREAAPADALAEGKKHPRPSIRSRSLRAAPPPPSPAAAPQRRAHVKG
jgi:hypothetical protein